MAQHGIQREKLSCSICLDLFKDPVTVPCGHSYCTSCIEDCWDEENDKKKTNSCPQCRQSFTSRPVLGKNTLLAELVEELKEVGLRAASSDRSSAGPGDVACDFCSGEKLKAFKSCLVCMASYCKQHLQPHYDVAPLKKHMLVEATAKLQENVCSRHDEVMKIFCRTDQRCICYLCSMDDHRGHDTASVATERAERQAELVASRQKIQQRVQDREKDAEALRQRVQAATRSADEAVSESEKIFTELRCLLEKRSAEVKQQIRALQKTHASQVEELEAKLQQKMADLRRRDAELEQLSHTEDHLHFLNHYPTLSQLSESEDLSGIDTHPLPSFKDVLAAAAEAGDKLQAVLLSEEWGKASLAVKEVAVLRPPAEPKTRAEFLKYSCQVTLDPNTAHKRVSLCGRFRKATLMRGEHLYSSHPDRFIEWWQVLSRESLAGRCYWEVKWSGKANIAVAYKDISRTGNRNECGFGYNDKSWSFECGSNQYLYRHNNTSTPVPDLQSSRVGVYLDHRAGTLSFYRVSETMTLLHRVQTAFTQPLHAGLWLPRSPGDAAELCELK
ncbi:tripartite motif-containing protein 16-like [Clinocottus analis]|uniref:tripartite motif-containing protein 16-like n=1 Tax=Clinocottus analis TaxID=304258 RepID=UPI0035C0E003